MSLLQKLVLLTFCTVLASGALGFTEYKKYGDQLWELELNSSLYQTQNNYLRSGNSYDSLPNGGYYKLTNFDLGARWSVSKSWALYGGTRIGAAESKDASLTRTTSQFNQVVLGTDFLMADGGNFKLIPDIQVTLPLQKTDAASNNVQTSEGATEVIGRVIARFDISRLLNQAFAGITYRDDGRATLLNFGAGSEFDFTGWYLGAEVRGYSTIINDQYTANPSTRESAALRVNGGSTKFNSINPSLLDSNFWYRWDNKKWGIKLGMGLSITGASTAAGNQIFAGYIYRFVGKEGVRSAPALKSDLDRFQIETNDGVDQILFQPEPPPKPLTPAPAPKKVNSQKIKDELNKTEMQVELKSLKKTKKKKKIVH